MIEKLKAEAKKIQEKYGEYDGRLARVAYESAVRFQQVVDNSKGQESTFEKCHEAGLKEAERLVGLKNEPEEVIDYVNLETGERFSCTENELMRRNA